MFIVVLYCSILNILEIGHGSIPTESHSYQFVHSPAVFSGSRGKAWTANLYPDTGTGTPVGQGEGGLGGSGWADENRRHHAAQFFRRTGGGPPLCARGGASRPAAGSRRSRLGIAHGLPDRADLVADAGRFRGGGAGPSGARCFPGTGPDDADGDPRDRCRVAAVQRF